MIFVDTNVIASLLVEERAEQREMVLAWAEHASAEGDDLVITESVLVEVCWVLERTYAFPRPSVAEALVAVVSSRPFRAWDSRLAHGALELMGNSPRLSITDCLLIQRAMAEESSVLSFDAKLRDELGG